MIYEQFRVTGTHDSVENYTDLFTIVLRNDDITTAFELLALMILFLITLIYAQLLFATMMSKNSIRGAQDRRLGLFQDSDFAGDLEDPKSTSGVFCAFWQSHIRSHKLDVQETNVSFTVRQNLRLFLLMQVYAWM